MKTIDTCGQLCPAPLILTKRGLTEAAEGEDILVLTDNETALGNLRAYLKELHIQPAYSREGNCHRLSFAKPAADTETVDAARFCSPGNDYAVVLKGETMGSGDPALGTLLMKAFLNALPEAERLPSTVLLYNAGVRLALEGADTAAALRKLEDLGVTVMSCGTCLDYYGVKDRLAVGTVGNMYKITEVLSGAGHVVYP